MAFYDRLYDLYLIFGSPEAQPLWRWQPWQAAVSALQPILTQARGEPAVRVHLEQADGAAGNGYGEYLGELTRPAWISPEDGQGDKAGNRQFLSLEMWAPDWETCKQENRVPDIYFAFRNEGYWAEKVVFNPLIILAVAADLHPSFRDAGRQVAIQVADLVRANLRIFQERPWGLSWAEGAGFTDGIADMMAYAPLKQSAYAPERSGPLTLNDIEGEWGEL